MNRLIYLLAGLILFDLTFQGCANPGRPTGGPQDTIPPVLIYANPTSGTTNFKGNLIELEFSEFVNADKLKQKLIITPKSDIRYKSVVKRNKLLLKLEDPLKDSTTYNFNFADGLTDITEKNPAVNLSIAFSTGSYIDSMSVQGNVEELLTKEPAEAYTVALYPMSDTLDFFTQQPLYFTTTNDSGRYKINYIQSGTYKILAFDDQNGNLVLDPETESHGFLAPNIILDSATTLHPIRCVLQNIKPLELINARPTGRYVETKFNKTIDTYTLTDSMFYHNLIGEQNDIIRLYKKQTTQYNDSISATIQASDSLGNTIMDTIKFVFLESNRKPAGFSAKVHQATIPLEDNPKINLTFNKPVLSTDSFYISIKADSIFTYYPTYSTSWNFNKTEVSIQLFFISDSLESSLEQLLLPDSSETDTVQAITNKTFKRKLELTIEKGSFISVEKDTAKVKIIPLEKPRDQPKGVLNISTQTNHASFFLQLLNSNDKVIYSSKGNKQITFASVKPATYKIRILIDDNNDSKWSYGNLILNEEPEHVYIYPEEISVRENWVIDLGITF